MTAHRPPSRTWACSVEIEFVSTAGSGLAPARANSASTMRRFCMSGESRHSGAVAASRQRTLAPAAQRLACGATSR